MGKSIVITCKSCGTKHKLSKGEDGELHHEVIEPQKPKEQEKPKEKSVLDVIFDD